MSRAEQLAARAWAATLAELAAEPYTRERAHLARRARRLGSLRRALMAREEVDA